MNVSQRLAGKVVLVTGAARGLGRAIARRCASEGATLMLVDILDEEGRHTVDELTSQGVDAVYRRADITSAADLTALFADIAARWGRLDGLVNNAALATRLAGKTFDQIDEASWDRVFDINVKGTWRVNSHALPLLKAAGAAHVVNMASDTALWGGDLFLHYVASKGAIISMTRGMARELAPFNITVNAVAPGLTPTEATEAAPARRWEQYRHAQMLKRDSTPEDIAAAVVMLLTDDAAFITGQTLTVNGGMTLN